jgi:hypothetical protein
MISNTREREREGKEKTSKKLKCKRGKNNEKRRN